MFVSTKTTSLMQRLAVQGAPSERKRGCKESQGSFACRRVPGVGGHQLPQLIGQQGADTTPAPRRDGSGSLQQRRFYRNRNVVLGSHGVGSGSRKIREAVLRVNVCGLNATGPRTRPAPAAAGAHQNRRPL